LDHYHKPHNFGQLTDPTCRVTEVNASCGDSMSLDLKVENSVKGLIVLDASFTGIGCAVSVAAASLLTDHVKGRTVAELKKIDFEFMQDLIGTTISPGRIKCLTLSAKALLNALDKALAAFNKA